MYTLEITTANPYARIRVFNDKLQVISNAIGLWKKELPECVYKIQVSAGDKTYRQLIELDGDKKIHISNDKIGFINSTIPVGSSEASVETGKIAKQLSTGNNNPETTGELFLFLSSYFAWNDAVEMCNDIQLCNDNGIMLHSFRNILCPHPEKTKNNYWCNGTRIPLKEGSYRLQIKINGQLVEQPIYISKDVQTQLFFTVCDHYTIDLQSMSVAQAKPMKLGFNPTAEERRYEACELAKELLYHSELDLNADHANNMAYAKFTNPILGIYSAHILIKHPQANEKLEFIHTIYTNCYKLLGAHPDLMAVGFWLQDRCPNKKISHIKKYKFDNPPMLKASWNILVELSKKNMNLIAINSLFAISSNSVISSGPWYLWLYNDEIKDFDDAEIMDSIYTEQGDEILPEIYAKLIETGNTLSLIKTKKLSILESSILNMMDNELPISFLSTLSHFIEKKYESADDEEKIIDEIKRLNRFMSRDITQLLGKTVQYIKDLDKKEKIETILKEYDNQQLELLKDRYEMGFAGFPQNLSKAYFSDEKLSSSLADQLNSTDNSISIALNGIKRKLEL